MSIEWRGAPTRIAHNRLRPEAGVSRTKKEQVTMQNRDSPLLMSDDLAMLEDGTRLSSRPSNREKVTSERRQTRDGAEALGELIHLSLLVCAVVLLRYAVARRSRRQRRSGVVLVL